MKIGAVSKKTGLTVDTIRYYERIGLLPPADRNAAGQRDYDPSVLTWIAFLHRLKETGMPLAEMVRYAKWREAGDSTIGERQRLLEKHRIHVIEKIDALQQSLSALDAKINTYQDMAKSNDEPFKQ